MLNYLIRWSLNHRPIVLSCIIFILIFGGLLVQQIPVDVFPDITRPTVTIMTEAHGMAPEEVETRVTMPIEMDLKGVPGVERVRSQSGVGLSVIYVEFEWGTEIYRGRQMVQEKLNLSKERLPQDVTPIMGPIGSLMGQIQQISITSESKDISPMDLRTFAEWTLRPRLLTIPGVSQVISIGGGLKQYQILVSAEKLNRYQISLDQLSEELGQISQNTTGGYLEKEGKEFLVRNLGAVESIEDIENTLVGRHFGKPIQVKDIAEVKVAPRVKRGDGSFNKSPSVVMTIQKQPGADTVRITNDVENAISEMKSSFPAGIVVNTDVFKQSRFIENSINGVKSKLKWGTVFVFIVLLIFLANLKMSLITLTAIPISFLVTFLVFHYFGLSINTMTLGGLAIAIGELVDDSIVDAENVFRRLRENANAAVKKPILKVIFDASSEVRNSIILATLIIALVFIPLFNLSGLEGRLFKPLGIAYLTALMASLLVSLTLTPVMCYYLLKGDLKEEKETRFVTWLKSIDKTVLELAFQRPKTVIVLSGLLFVGSLSLIPIMGSDFLPKFNEGTAMVAVSARPGVSLEESNRMGLIAEAAILRVPEVKSVSRRTGRAEMDEHAMGVNVSEIDIDFKPSESGSSRSRETVLNQIRDEIKNDIPDVGVGVGQPISHLIDHMLSGVSAAIAIKLFGDDLSILRKKSLEIESAIKDIPGLVDVRVEQQGLIPQVKIQILRDEAAQFGISPGEATHLLETAFNGKIVSQILDRTQVRDLFFQFDDVSRGSIKKMENTIVKINPDGRSVRLADIADIYESNGPNEINRENGQRRIVISANSDGRDLGSLISEIKSKISQKVTLPANYFILFGGQFESQQKATRKIILFSLVSLIGIALLLYSHFHSAMITMQIMITIPLAFVGGIVSLFLVDRVITVASLVGFITLCGMAARNGIMMISHYLHLMNEEGHGFSKDMIIKGSQERLVPVLMTASVAALALLPLVFTAGQPGSEILHPVAVVIVGGLLSSTLLDIVVTPTVFLFLGKKSAEDYILKTKQKLNNLS